MKSNKQKGFTLIELLVVLAIIGILASLILANLATARKKSRDSRRKSDITALKSAVELYADDNNYAYPTAASATNAKNLGTPFSNPGPASKYIQVMPTDPLNAATPYLYLADTSNYAFFAKLEAGALPNDYYCATSGYSGIVTLEAAPDSWDDCLPSTSIPPTPSPTQ